MDWWLWRDTYVAVCSSGDTFAAVMSAFADCLACTHTQEYYWSPGPQPYQSRDFLCRRRIKLCPYHFSHRGRQWAHGITMQCPANPWTPGCQGWNHGIQLFHKWWTIVENPGPLLWLIFSALWCVYVVLRWYEAGEIDICYMFLFSQNLHSLCNAP